ncbi:MAG: DNA polymerase III subunit delta [Pseudomonadales bacterium]|nr:DNA polymerase III subunit delta [Pseudomonadales bacterium]NIX08802.1 DNA polymerase III subunit delta [Pseudomonadales bacterium]
MPLRLPDLPSRLSAGLAPLYFISGDETLLVQEACDAILGRAQAEGFTERSVLHVERGFRWNDILQDAASLSLFAEKRIIDVRVRGNSFDREASEILRAYAADPSSDTLLLIRSARLEPRQRSSAWFKALDAAGVVVLVWPVGIAELPRWLAGRLRAAGLSLTPDAESFLAQQVEGNLLAAVQEVEKLKLADLPQPIGTEELVRQMEDSAHYDAFELIDAVFAGDGARVSRILANLRQEGVSLYAVLAALTGQLRRLPGGRMAPQRQRLVDGFVRRLRLPNNLHRVLSQCALVDAQGKGQLLGDAWLSLENVCLRLAGQRGLPSLEQEVSLLRRS